MKSERRLIRLSRNKRYKNKANKNESGATSNPPRKQAQDSFQNPLARLGLGSNSLLEGTQYPIQRITRNYNLMNSLYRNSWIAKKIINTIPEDMCKNWFSLSAKLTPEAQDRFDKLEQKTRIKEKVVEGLTWGRLYGGAGAIMLIEGHEDILDEPLNLEDIMPNSFKGLMILDRWSGIYPGIELITDISDPDFGLPEFYEIKDIDGNIKQKVHHSRVLRFTGRKLPFWEDQAETYWGASELEHVYDELVKRDNTSWNIASLIFQANVLVNKVEGLDQILAMTDAQVQKDFYNVKTAQNQMRSSSAMLLIGDKDELSALNYTFAGLNDIYESFMLDVAGACDMPVTKLFGRAPAGMNATGESDENMYYDMIAQQQESVLKPKMEKLLPVMFMSEFGQVPDDLGIKFNPIKTPSDSDVADIVGKKVTAIDTVFNSGIISQKIAMAELHEISYTTNMFTNITDEDIEKADDDTNPSGDIPPYEAYNQQYNTNDSYTSNAMDADPDNLQIEIKSEQMAIDQYKLEIERSKKQGDSEAVKIFEEILKDEEDHLNLLNNIKKERGW
jgi:phage-related protein (TIGR01555 family)